MKKSSTKTSDKSNKKRKWSMPASITILLVILAIVVMVTWVVPSGYYGPDGSFHTSNENGLIVDAIKPAVDPNKIIKTPTIAS